VIISDHAIRNRTTVLVLVILIVAGGLMSYISLPREAAPDVPIPRVIITTAYEGVSPEDVESSITIKIEKKLTGLKGLKEITSSSAEGLSVIVAEFLPDVRIEDALQYVRDKVDQAKADLPTDSKDFKDPVIQEINISEFPIMMINMTGTISPVTLKAIADELEETIEEVPGVLNVDVLGGLEREIRIEIDPDRVAAYGLTVGELLALIPSEHVNISAGGMETPGVKFNVRVPAEFVEPDEVDHWPLTTRDGRTIYLSDVARVRDTFKDRTNYARLDGVSSITLSVQKRTGENVIRITAIVKAILAEAQKRLPAGVKFNLTLDQSKDIRMMVSDLENNLFAAFVLVLTILMIFLGLRASLVVAVAVPISMLMSFAVISMLGYTLNMIVLFSLVLAIGMLVDNAIVIVENVYRHMQLGYGRFEAARKGTAEVAWPVITSALTTIAAFTPLLFWPGIIGDFMKYLPITVIVVLSSSLFVAMVISPVVCTLVAPRAKPRDHSNFIVRGYKGLLSLALEHRLTAISLAFLGLAAMAIVYVKRGAGLEFFPDVDPRRAIVNIRSPQGTSIRQSDALARLVEQRIEARRQAYRGVLEHVVANAGSSGESIFGGGTGGPHVSNVTLLFVDYEDRVRPSADVVADLREHLTDIPGAEIKVEKEKEGPPTGAPVTVRIIGRDFKELEKYSGKAKAMIANVPGLVNLRSDLEATRPELAFRVDRKRAMELGVNTFTVGHFLKTSVFGAKVGDFRQFNDEYDITVRLPVSQRSNFDDLLRLRVPSSSGKAVPLSSLGRFEYRGGFGTIHRVAPKRVVTLTADNEGRLADDVLKDVQEILSPLGRNRLIARDVADWGAFCAALKQGAPSGPLARRIRERLPSNARRLIDQAEADGPADTKDRQAILDALNGKDVLRSRDLCRPGELANLTLPAEARALAETPRDELTTAQVQRLNRLATESALGGLIAKSVKLGLPEGYEVRYAGEKEEQDKAAAFLFKAFGIALLLIVLVLVAQFNTVTAPFIIMITVGLSMIGVLVGLLVSGLPFGVIMTGVGVISLAGVVVNNAIVLLDYTRKLQRRGLDLVAASIEAGTTRLRPVLLTATTTIIGLVPTAIGMGFDIHTLEFYSKSESSQFWRSMAVAVIFGLGFATILTLVVVPTLYVTLYRLAARLGLGGLKKVQTPGELIPPAQET